MKTIHNPRSDADRASSSNTFKPILYSHLLSKAVLGILIAFLTTACHPSPNDSTPAPQGSGKPANDSTNAISGKPIGNPPGDSIRVFNRLKISLSFTDFRKFKTRIAAR